MHNILLHSENLNGNAVTDSKLYLFKKCLRVIIISDIDKTTTTNYSHNERFFQKNTYYKWLKLVVFEGFMGTRPLYPLFNTPMIYSYRKIKYMVFIYHKDLSSTFCCLVNILISH